MTVCGLCQATVDGGEGHALIVVCPSCKLSCEREVGIGELPEKVRWLPRPLGGN